ncbi:MAG TPA: succinate dehydrogenase, cytochrome b556 subunit [Steroidobacteraceae bacterium]|nr:succinate dehydrogenase, cytochrome b556 subunit [Steroidobacteraceae bacterium]
MRERPLSPHWTIYRMSRYSLLSSFANRATGALLSVGLLVLIYWLTSLARGAHAYARAQAVLGSDLARVVYAGLIVAFCYHLVAGIRHLVWDTGRGLEKAQSQRSAWLVITVSVLLAAAVCFWALRAREGV